MHASRFLFGYAMTMRYSTLLIPITLLREVLLFCKIEGYTTILKSSFIPFLF